MAQWIFDLKPGQTGACLVRGLMGSVVAPTNDAIREVVLEASYTDAGALRPARWSAAVR